MTPGVGLIDVTGEPDHVASARSHLRRAALRSTAWPEGTARPWLISTIDTPGPSIRRRPDPVRCSEAEDVVQMSSRRPGVSAALRSARRRLSAGCSSYARACARSSAGPASRIVPIELDEDTAAARSRPHRKCWPLRPSRRTACAVRSARCRKAATALELALPGVVAERSRTLQQPLGTVKTRIRSGLLKLRESCAESRTTDDARGAARAHRGYALGI